MATKLWLGNVAGHEGEAGWGPNYSPTGLPTDADDLYYRESSQDVDDELGALVGVQLRSVHIEQSFAGLIGTLAAYLELAAGEVHIGRHDGPGSPSGSPRIKLDLVSGSGGGFASGSFGSAPRIFVYNTAGNPQETNLPPVRLLTDDPDAELHVRRGRVGVAVEPGEVSILGHLFESWESGREGDAEVIVGEGVTGLAEVVKDGGVLVLRCAATLVRNRAGTLTVQGAGAIPNLYADGGQVYPESSGLLTNLHLRGADVDMTRSTVVRAVTNLRIDPTDPGSIAYDPAVVAVANIILAGPTRLAFQEAG